MVTEVASVSPAYKKLELAKAQIIIQALRNPYLSIKARTPSGNRLEIKWDPMDPDAWFVMNMAVSCRDCPHFISYEVGLEAFNRAKFLEGGFLYIPDPFMGICIHDPLQPRTLTEPFLDRKGCKKLAREEVLNALSYAIAKV